MTVAAQGGSLQAGGLEAEAGLPIARGGLGSRAQQLALATLCVVLFLTFLDNTVVSVGLASIQQDLHAGVTSLQWVVNGYALTFASFMLAAGTAGDLLGRKKVMLAGVAVFCAGSVLTALAPTATILVVGRVVMGLGAAASEPGTLSVLRHVYPDRRTRADALGIWAAVSGLALALGPVIAGVLVGAWNWRAIFWFNLVVGAIAFALAAAFVPESSDRDGRRFDIPGIILGAVTLGSLSFAIIQGEVWGYASDWVLAFFALSVVAAVCFVVAEHRSRAPMLELCWLKVPAFSGSIFVAFAAYFGTFSIFFFTALYLQEVVGSSPFTMALDFLPMAVGLVAASALTGPWVARAGPRIPMTVGCVVAGGGILATNVVLGPHAGFGDLSWSLALAGIGFGIALVPVTSAALGSVAPERSGMAASVTNTARELGAVLGVAVLGAIVDSKLTGQLSARLKQIGIPPHFQNVVMQAVTTGGASSGGAASSAEHSKNSTVATIATKVVNAAYNAFGSGLHVALEISAALILVGAVVAFLTVRRPASGAWGTARQHGHDEPEEPPEPEPQEDAASSSSTAAV